MEHEGDGDTNCNQCARYSHQRIDKRREGLKNKMTSGNHLNNSIYCLNRSTATFFTMGVLVFNG